MRVRFRAKALDDINGFFNYRVRVHSLEVAARAEAAIFAATRMLGDYPEIGTMTDHPTGVRRWPMTDYGYAIFYLVNRPGSGRNPAHRR